MYTMSALTKENVERVIGMKIGQLNNMTAEEEQAWVKKRSNQKIVFSKTRRHRVIGRGNPLVSRRKIRTLADLDARSKEIIGI